MLVCDINIEIDIDGVAIDQIDTGLVLLEMQPYVRDGHTILSFGRVLGALPAFPDPWDNKPVVVKISGTTYFSGFTGRSLTHYDGGKGWCREWTCFSLSKMAEYCPVTDSNSLTDHVRFNTAPDDPQNIQSRDGRTIGQAVLEVLSMPQNSAALRALGVGKYSSAGTGATATCTVVGKHVSTVTITAGGTSYTVAPAVVFSGGGGAGATGTAAVSGGAVTGITITNAGSGYLEPPAVIISTLPAQTLADLDQLNFLPPGEIPFSGEHILQSIEGAVQGGHPNHYLQVLGDGTIRFLDPRTFTATINAILNQTTDDNCRWDMPQVTLDWSQSYTRCVVRGNSYVVSATLQTQPWPTTVTPTPTDGGLTENFDHDGLTNTQAKDLWRSTDFNSPLQPQGTATAHASVTTPPGPIASITVDNKGYNYASAPTVLIADATGTGATATAALGSGATAGQVTGITVTAGGSGYSSGPTVTLTGPAVGQSDVGTCTMVGSGLSTGVVRVTSSNARANWPADYWDQTNTGHHGAIILRSEIISGVTQTWSSNISANTLLAAGGTSDITLQTPAPATSYTSYQIYGFAGGASFVWRRYKVTNTAVAAQMTNEFPWPVAYANSDGTAASMVSTPQCVVQYSTTGSPPYSQIFVNVSIDPASGTILLARPSALAFSADGRTPVVPSNVQVFLPVNTGALVATYPPDVSGVPQYAGTAYSQLSIQRTKYLSMPDWKDSSQSSSMQLFAQNYHGTCSNVVIEGTITYHGLLIQALTPGQGLTITGVSYTTGYESMILPVVACNIRFNQRGEGGSLFETQLTFSTRRMPFTGSAFQRPAMTGEAFGFQAGMPGGIAEAARFGVSGVMQAARLGAQQAYAAGRGGTNAQFGQYVQQRGGLLGDAQQGSMTKMAALQAGAGTAQERLAGGAMAGQAGLVGGTMQAMASMGAFGTGEEPELAMVSREHGGAKGQTPKQIREAQEFRRNERIKAQRDKEAHRLSGVVPTDQRIEAGQKKTQAAGKARRDSIKAAKDAHAAHKAATQAHLAARPIGLSPESPHVPTVQPESSTQGMAREVMQAVGRRPAPEPGSKAADVTRVAGVKPETPDEKEKREDWQRGKATPEEVARHQEEAENRNRESE